MEKVLIVMVEVKIGIRISTIPPITHMTMLDYLVYLLLLVLFTKVFMVMKDVIIVMMTEGMDFGLKITGNINFTTAEKVLMAT